MPYTCTVLTCCNKRSKTVFLFARVLWWTLVTSSSVSFCILDFDDWLSLASYSTDLLNSSSFSFLYAKTSLAASSFACLNRSVFAAHTSYTSIIRRERQKPLTKAWQTLTSFIHDHLGFLFGLQKLLDSILSCWNFHLVRNRCVFYALICTTHTASGDESNEAHGWSHTRVIVVTYQRRQLMGLLYKYTLASVHYPIRPNMYERLIEEGCPSMQIPLSATLLCPFEFIDISNLYWYRIETPCLIER